LEKLGLAKTIQLFKSRFYPNLERLQKSISRDYSATLDSLFPKEKNIYWSSSPSIGWGKKESLHKAIHIIGAFGGEKNLLKFTKPK
jgi:hypothetical protein